MELRQLHFFLTVAERLNFSRAADALYISQPALSYQIAELERELGVDLFFRDRRKVSLTIAGQTLLPLAREALQAAERLRDSARGGAAATNHGPLRVGFDITEDHFECTGITKTLALFIERFSQVRLEMSQADVPTCVEKLQTGDLDMAFVVMRHNERLEPGLACRPVHRDRLMLIFRETNRHGATMRHVSTCEEALAHFDLLLVAGKPRGQSRILACMADCNPSVRTVDSLPSAFTLVHAGLAATVLPSNYYRNHQYDSLVAIDIPAQGALLQHCAVWNKLSTSPHVLGLLELLPTLPEPASEA